MTDASAEQLLPSVNPESEGKDAKQSAEKRLAYTSARVEELESKTQVIPETEKKNVAADMEASTKKLEQQMNQKEFNNLWQLIDGRIKATESNVQNLQSQIQGTWRIQRPFLYLSGVLPGWQRSLEANQRLLITLNNLRQRLELVRNSPSSEVLQGVRKEVFFANFDRVLGPNGQRVIKFLQRGTLREVINPTVVPRTVEGIDTEMSPYTITATGRGNSRYEFNFQQINERMPSPSIVIQATVNGNPVGSYVNFEQFANNLMSDIIIAQARETRTQQEKQNKEAASRPWWRFWRR